MKYVRLGSSGLKVSRICLGMMSYGDAHERAWHLDESAGREIVARAVNVSPASRMGPPVRPGLLCRCER